MASLFVHKETYGWRIIEEIWSGGKRKHLTVPRISYQTLGINPDWTLEEAREAVKRLNKQNKLNRDQHSKITGISRRVDRINRVTSAYLPEDLKRGFTEHLEISSFGSMGHKTRLLAMFESVCKIIQTLELDPKDFEYKSGVVYNYLILKHYSQDYSKKLIRMLNMWGKYVSTQRGIPYAPVPKVPRQVSSKIDDSFQNTPRRGRRVSDPLTPEHLKTLDSTGYNEEYLNWLTLSVWFGLRPSEVDSLHDPKNYRVSTENGAEVLYIYQSKLTQMPREQRWKGIPCLYPEQTRSLVIAKRRAFKRPSSKGLKQALNDYKIDLYGGRKGFIDLMLDRNQKLEDISAWMGHQDISITWKKYRNKKRVSWSKVG